MGLLDRECICQLDRLGVVWEPRKRNREDMFAELVAYRAKHGDCNVPLRWSENPRLGLWVHRQRQSRRRSTLPQDHISQLDKIGFVWTRCEAWESKYAALVEYKRMHGDCRVSTLSEEYAVLGNWVHTLRTYRKQGKLSEEQIGPPGRIGFRVGRKAESKAHD